MSGVFAVGGASFPPKYIVRKRQFPSVSHFSLYQITTSFCGLTQSPLPALLSAQADGDCSRLCFLPLLLFTLAICCKLLMTRDAEQLLDLLQKCKL